MDKTWHSRIVEAKKEGCFRQDDLVCARSSETFAPREILLREGLDFSACEVRSVVELDDLGTKMHREIVANNISSAERILAEIENRVLALKKQLQSQTKESTNEVSD